MRTAHEVSFDGLVGPTHNYAGLSYGNVASAANAGRPSNPREAALQGIAKMRHVRSLGVLQAVLPPHPRPDVDLLRRLGFTGSDREVLETAAREEPVLLAAASSASAMWTANAATVAPSADTEDGKVHFTAANLENKLHRSIEAPVTSRALRAIFQDPRYFVHHDPLPSCDALGDEGAANHTRLAREHGRTGVQLFVWGRSVVHPTRASPAQFPARQTLQASQAIARRHRLSKDAVVFAQQSPELIDQGVFHNDVIAVGNEHVFLVHEQAFVDSSAVLSDLSFKYERLTGGGDLVVIEARADRLSVEDAVTSYVFNSQLVTVPSGKMAILAPSEAFENDAARRFLEEVVAADNPVEHVHYLDLRQSMRNGGGPACLRLRVVLTGEELAATNPKVMFDDALDARLVAWVEQHYRDRLDPEELADPKLLEESRRALDELTQILGIGSIYDFQRA